MSNRIVNTAKRATQIVNTSARANSLEGVTVAKDLGGRAAHRLQTRQRH